MYLETPYLPLEMLTFFFISKAKVITSNRERQFQLDWHQQPK